MDPERFPLGPSDPHEFAHHEFQRRVRLRSRRSKLSVSSSWKEKNISPLAFHYLSVRTGVLGGFLSLIVALSSRGAFDWPCGRGGRREVFNLAVLSAPRRLVGRPTGRTLDCELLLYTTTSSTTD